MAKATSMMPARARKGERIRAVSAIVMLKVSLVSQFILYSYNSWSPVGCQGDPYKKSSSKINSLARTES
jgi:hypothetical protein